MNTPAPDRGPAIRVRDLTKEYRRFARLRDLFVEGLTGLPRHTAFQVLKGLTFDVAHGEVLGIVGGNGAGKSTLLKILAGTLNLSGGEVEVNGRVSAILELGTGFHPDRTGRENVLLGGMCLGMSRAEVERKIEGIIDFSGIRDFIDQPFRTYSSGMQARLTFATAAAVDPDILIVDEALATGDAMFVSKCMARMREICNSGSTVLLVSHSTALLAQLCDRILWLDRGEIRMFGEPHSVLRAYDLSVHAGSSGGRGRVEPAKVTINGQPPTTGAGSGPVVYRAGPVYIRRIELLDGAGRPTTSVASRDAVTVRVWYECEGPPPAETLGMAICINRKHDLLAVSQCYTQNIAPGESQETYALAEHRSRPAAEGYIEAVLSPIQLAAGEYYLNLGLLPNVPGAWEFYEYHHLCHEFQVTPAGDPFGAVMYANVQWRHVPNAAGAIAPERAA